jgi:hypothetical protein
MDTKQPQVSPVQDIGVLTRREIEARIVGPLLVLCQAVTFGSYPMSWRFHTEDARIKLRRLYPKVID